MATNTTKTTARPKRKNAKPAKPRITNDMMVRALKATDGGVYAAADKLKCHPSTIYDRAKGNSEVQDAIDHPRMLLVDLAETALKKAVKAGEAWAVCFALKTQGKARGYIERQDIGIGQADPVDFDWGRAIGRIAPGPTGDTEASSNGQDS